MDSEYSMTLEQTPDFPDAYKPVSTATGEALSELRKHDDINWTYFSPAADYQPEGARTDRYAIAGEEFTVNDKGESYFSYQDMEQATLDVIESGEHHI